MSKTNVIFLIALGLLMSMCTAQRPVVRSFPTPEPPVSPSKEALPTLAERGYEGALLPAFYYTEGLKASEVKGDPIGAARLFDKAIEIDSTHSPSYFAAANNIALLDPDLALQYSRTANRLDSDNEWYRTQLARLLVMNMQYNEALREYEQLLKTSPNNPENYRMLAALHEVNRQPFAAIALLDSAESRFGRMEELTGFKREIYIKLKMYDQAIGENLGMIAEYPYNYENYLIAGDLYLIKGEDSLARTNLERASALRSDGIDVLASLVNYYRTTGDNANFFATAKKLFRHKEMDVRAKIALYRDITRDMQFYAANYYSISELILLLRAEHPENYEVMELYAANLFANGQTDEGLNIYKNYISDTTSIVEPFVFILEGEAFMGRMDSMNKYALMAIEKFPDNTDLYLRRGSALAYMKQEKEALEVYGKVLKLAGTDSLRAAVYGHMGDVYHQMDKDRQAFANYEKALKLYPDNVLVLNNYAYFLSLLEKDLGKALRMALRVMELEPGNATYIDTYGWVLFKMGRYEDAKRVLQQAVSLDLRDSQELLLHYGDILYEMGDHFMAKYYWEKALEAGYEKEPIDVRMKKLEEK